MLIAVSAEGRMASVSLQDNRPALLIQTAVRAVPTGVGGSGLGLNVSRAAMRSYGGDLRYEWTARGACFREEIPIS